MLHSLSVIQKAPLMRSTILFKKKKNQAEILSISVLKNEESLWKQGAVSETKVAYSRSVWPLYHWECTHPVGIFK